MYLAENAHPHEEGIVTHGNEHSEWESIRFIQGAFCLFLEFSGISTKIKFSWL